MKIRMERVNSELQKQIAAVIAHDVKDPRLSKGIVSVTKVTTTPDLKFAKVENEEARREVLETVRRSKHFIRNRLKDLVEIRLLPDLDFKLDTSVDYGMKIDKLLSTIDIPEETEEETEEEK